MTLLTRRGLFAGAAGLAAPKRKRKPVGMKPDEQGVFFQVVVQGGGVFTYDAAGNLRSANVGQTVTDPIQGITCYAGFSTFNGHGAVISLFSSTLDAQLWYVDTGSSTQGALIVSVASGSGTDPFGNAFTGGGPVSYGSSTKGELIGSTLQFVSTAAGTLITTGSVIDLVDALTNSAQPELFLTAPLTSAGVAAQMGLFGESHDTTKPAQVVIAAATPAPTTSALLEVQGATDITTGGLTVTAGGLSVTGGETADTVAVSSSQAAGDVLTVTNTHGAPTNPSMQITAQSSGDLALGIEVTGDADERLVIRSNGEIDWSSGAAAADVKLNRSGAGVLSLTVSDFNIGTVGRGLQVKTGANAKVGTAALVGGTISVPNTSVTANSIILLGQRTPGGTPGALFVSAVVVGTSFTIKSTSATDTSTVGYLIVETT